MTLLQLTQLLFRSGQRLEMGSQDGQLLLAFFGILWRLSGKVLWREEIKINICFPLVSLLCILFASLIGLTLIRLLGCLRLPFVDFVRLSVHSMASTTMAIDVWQIATLSANWQ